MSRTASDRPNQNSASWPFSPVASKNDPWRFGLIATLPSPRPASADRASLLELLQDHHGLQKNPPDDVLALDDDRLEPHIYGPTSPGGREQFALTQGEYREDKDPARAGVNAAVSNMLRNRWGKPEIAAYLTKAGIDLSTVRGFDEVLVWQHKHPRYRGNYTVELETRRVPMGDAAAGVNRFLQSPGGTALASSADKMSVIGLDKLSSDPDRTRGALSQLQRENPYAAAIGTTMGNAAASYTLDGLLAAAAVPAAMRVAGLNMPVRPLMVDAMTGAGEGWGSAQDGERTKGALLGIGKNMLLGQALRPASDAAEAHLAGALGNGWAKPAANVANSAIGTAMDAFTIAPPSPSNELHLDPIDGLDMLELYDLLSRRGVRPSVPMERWREVR